MSERKSVNKNHPDFPEYIEKCRALWAEYKPRFDALEKKAAGTVSELARAGRSF